MSFEYYKIGERLYTLDNLTYRGFCSVEEKCKIAFSSPEERNEIWFTVSDELDQLRRDADKTERLTDYCTALRSAVQSCYESADCPAGLYEHLGELLKASMP